MGDRVPVCKTILIIVKWISHNCEARYSPGKDASAEMYKMRQVRPKCVKDRRQGGIIKVQRENLEPLYPEPSGAAGQKDGQFERSRKLRINGVSHKLVLKIRQCRGLQTLDERS